MFRLAGHEAIAHDAVFSPTARDEEWLEYAGQERLIVITKDKMIRKRPNELATRCNSSLQVIMLTSGSTKMADYAETLVMVLPKIQALLARTSPPVIISCTL